MEAELVFNDLSITTAPSEELAREWLTDMMAAVADLIDEKINGKPICNRAIRTNRDFYDIDLTEDYGYIEWLEDAQVSFSSNRLFGARFSASKVQVSHRLTFLGPGEKSARLRFLIDSPFLGPGENPPRFNFVVCMSSLFWGRARGCHASTLSFACSRLFGAVREAATVAALSFACSNRSHVGNPLKISVSERVS
jgi:hypothetical protein